MRKSAFGFAAVLLCGLGMAPLLVETDAIDRHDGLARPLTPALETVACYENWRAAPTARCAIERATALADAR